MGLACRVVVGIAGVVDGVEVEGLAKLLAASIIDEIWSMSFEMVLTADASVPNTDQRSKSL